jgi:hypothetical protein
MRIAFLCLLGVLILAAGAYRALELRKPRFPFEVLKVKDGGLSSSIDYNPHSDYPPAHRWQIGLSFEKFPFGPEHHKDAPYVSFTVDLGNKGWRDLAGSYDLTNRNGSDFWHGDANLGPVELDHLEIKNMGGSKFQITLHLVFQFEETGYRQEKKTFVFQTDYEGAHFIAPTWNESNEVKFPPSWAVPSVNPHWSDEETRQFVGRYLDLSQYRRVNIDQTKSSTMLDAIP